MRRPNDDHLAQPYRVHALAPDFELLDVWRYPIVAPKDVAFATFLEFMVESQRALVSGNGPAARLFRLRGWLGERFGWDREESRPDEDTPQRESLRARLPAADRDAADPMADLRIDGDIGFDAIYRNENESLGEIRNATVHALMHLGRVEVEGGWSPQMAVYVKPRGVFGRLYMAAIGPFRHAIVYPAMMRAAEKGWPGFLARHRDAD
ncbi:MAG: DUF2867 domain-containing protein [bacterium]|nr:DUF2867 domain-containing protein [bacterium]